MNRTDVERISAAGRAKLDALAKYPVRYVSRAAMAGAFVMVGTLLSVACAAWFYDVQLGVSKVLGAFSFSAALILVVLIGGELFTGTNFILSVTLMEKKGRIAEAVKLWVICYFGNLLGVLVLAVLVKGSGVGAGLLTDYLTRVVPGRLDCTPLALICKGALCNFLVCTGVYGGLKLSSESGKCIVILVVITTFVLLGFEHSIANMGTFSLYILLTASPDTVGVLWHMLWVTVGNMLGGAALLAVPVWMSAEPK